MQLPPILIMLLLLLPDLVGAPIERGNAMTDAAIREDTTVPAVENNVEGDAAIPATH